MPRQKSYRKRKRSAKEKRNLFFALILVLIFVISFVVAIYFITLPAT
ncbi:MAG: hypothetical protein ACTSRS_03415 [Candidatus Helarchaeota archaeon]